MAIPEDIQTEKDEVFVSMGAESLKQCTQQLLEAKRLARSLESTIDALLPLVDGTIDNYDLCTIRDSSAAAARTLTLLYTRVARKALSR